MVEFVIENLDLVGCLRARASVDYEGHMYPTCTGTPSYEAECWSELRAVTVKVVSSTFMSPVRDIWRIVFRQRQWNRETLIFTTNAVMTQPRIEQILVYLGSALVMHSYNHKRGRPERVGIWGARNPRYE